MYNLGQLYQTGHGVSQDYAMAVKWYRVAAENGSVKAANSLGMAYLDGMGVEMDPVKAARYFQSAAQKGNVSAQYNLAILFIQQPEALAKGGIKASDAQAVQWLKKSAESGNTAAMEYLSDVYRDGKLGQKKNKQLADSWWDKAQDIERKREQYAIIEPLPTINK